MAAYQKAVEGVLPAAQRRVRGDLGTFDRLTQDYFSSPDYLRLASTTQRAYRLVIERLIRDENIGHRLVSEMTREHIKKMVAKRAMTPGAANDVLKKLKILVHFAIDNGLRTDDPTLRIKKFSSTEFHTWTDEEIDRMFTWAGKGQSKVYTRLANSEKLADAASVKREGNSSIPEPLKRLGSERKLK